MKKIVFTILALVVLSLALMAQKVEIIQTKGSDIITLKIDDNVVLKTTDMAKVDNYFRENNRTGIGDWNNSKFDYNENTYDHNGNPITITHCHMPANVNNCAKMAAKVK